MTTAWASAADLAGAPGLPDTARSIARRAQREAWPHRQRQGRGGGREYAIDALPAETRAWLAARTLNKAVSIEGGAGRSAGRRESLRGTLDDAARVNRQAGGLVALERLRGGAKTRAEARLEIVEAFEAFRRTAGLSAAAALPLFVAHYNAGAVPVDEATLRAVPRAAVSSVKRWRTQARREGGARLAGNYGSRRGDSLIDRDPALRDFVLGMLVEYPHCTGKQVYRALQARFGERCRVSRRTVDRWLARWRDQHPELRAAVSNPDGWKNRFMTAFGSASEAVARLNQLWEFDSTPADVLLADGRHAIIGVIDVYSRRARLLVSPTSKAVAVASLTRRALLDWGVPEVAKTDNGQDYVSKHLRRVFAALDITHEVCPPFTPEGKPHIERFFKTFSHDIAELLAGYVGHDVPQRQAIEARRSFADRLMARGGEPVAVRMTAAQLQAFCDRWLADLYEQEPHSGLDGKRPVEVAAGWTGGIRRVPDERALDLLLAEAPRDACKVYKKGLRIDRQWYIAPELGERVGQRLHVRYDPHDMGRVYVFDGDGSYICIARSDLEGVERQEVAAIAKQRQREAMRAARAQLKRTARKQDLTGIAHEILDARRDAPGTVVALPPRATDHASAGLAAATVAADARDALDQPAAPGAVDPAAVARVTQLMRAEQQAEETAEDRFRRWLVTAHQAQTSEIEQRWLDHYEQTSEFRGRYLIFAEQGGAPWGVDLPAPPLEESQ